MPTAGNAIEQLLGWAWKASVEEVCATTRSNLRTLSGASGAIEGMLGPVVDSLLFSVVTTGKRRHLASIPIIDPARTTDIGRSSFKTCARFGTASLPWIPKVGRSR